MKLTDDPRTPVNLFPLKGEFNCSPHAAQSKNSPCLLVSHNAYKPLEIKLKLYKPLITVHVEFLRTCSVFLYLNCANVLENEMKLRSKKGKIVFEPSGLKGRRIHAVSALTDLGERVSTVAEQSEKVHEHACLHPILPICFYYPRF